MKFVVEVGDVLKRKVEFSFNQLLGRTVIRADGREIKRNVRLFSEPLHESHVVSFGDTERIELRIEKKRKHLVGSQYSVYVNDRLRQCLRGV